jgi:hypothetical protein
MATYLRIAGKDLNIDELLSDIDIEPSRVWKKGEKKFKSIRPNETHKWSGVSFCASDADMGEFDLQVQDCIEFLNEFQAEISRMLRASDIEEAALDFGIELRDVAIHSDYLPAELIKLAGHLGIGIELSHYPPMKDER